MFGKLGIGCLLAGLFVGIFGGISNLMQVDNLWVGLTLTKLLGEDRAESIITWFDSAAIQDNLDLLFYDVPFFVLILSLGVILIVISLFVKDH